MRGKRATRREEQGIALMTVLLFATTLLALAGSMLTSAAAVDSHRDRHVRRPSCPYRKLRTLPESALGARLFHPTLSGAFRVNPGDGENRSLAPRRILADFATREGASANGD